MLNPDDFIITRKRKKYKFAVFANSPRCFELDHWHESGVMPAIAEVGAGTGLFGVELARVNPGKMVVAVDVKADRLITGARKADADGIEAVRFLRARADLLAEILEPHSLEQLWVTFPDPFAKKKSGTRRLTHPRYLAVYETLLRPDGALYFKTDSHYLFDWSLEQLVAEGWRIEELSFDLHESNLNDVYKVKTTYEMRYTAEGLPIHFVKAIPPKK